MLGRATGAVLSAIEARLVLVEVDLARGLPTVAAVGLPDPAVREGLDRLRAALRHAGFPLPRRRITINLAPADLPKHGAGLDLPIAAALLAADGVFAFADPSTVAVGELALDGSLRSVPGALSIAMTCARQGIGRLVLPRENAAEAALVEGLTVLGAADLGEAVRALAGRPDRPPASADARSLLAAAAQGRPAADLADVRGQATARRALEVAAAGGHHLLLSGSPGSGKTMLARRLPGILPPLSLQEALQVTRVWSASGLASGLVVERPFRAPHHGISFAGLTGGGARLRPGEITLASGGVLYLDELTEFRRDALEALRQPLEDGSITVVRIRERATLPAAFSLVASMNPCPCGHAGSPTVRCTCTEAAVRRYRARLSGPLLDRFDLVVDVPPVDLASLTGSPRGEGSTEVRRRVVAARERQRERFGPDGPPSNARMSSRDLDRFAPLPAAPRRLLAAASARLGLSARGFDRIRRVALTLADLDGDGAIAERHVAEAIAYRRGGADVAGTCRLPV